jgi:hypothetical protein
MTVLGIIISGFALMCAWNWFLVPVIPSIPVLGFGASCGVSLAKSIIFFRHDVSEENLEGDELAKSWLLAVFKLIIFIGVAWNVEMIIY